MKFEKKLLNWWWSSVVTNNDLKREAGLTPTKGFSSVTDIDYFGDEKIEHCMDIFRPEGTENEKLPVIIDIHGGGWMYGDKDLNSWYCKAVSTRGYAVVSFSYTLFPHCTFPIPVQEIFKAINFVYDNAEKYNIDINNMFLTGDSAGGHYAGLVLSIIADEKLQKLYEVSTKAKFNAVCFTCAAFYPNNIAKIPVHLTKTYVRMFYNGEKDYKNNKFYKSNDIANNNVKAFPPIMVNSCYNDMMKGQNLKFIKFLDENKIPYYLDFPKKYECKNKMGHVYAVLYPEDWEESKRTIDNMCNFFKKNLKNN